MKTINDKEKSFIDDHDDELSGITGDKVIGFVYASKDYENFKFMNGNRTATPSRIGVIAKSYEDHGMYRCPAIVNDNKEIIDGEGRKGAAKIAGLPYVYVIDSKAGADAMGVLNVAQKNWNDADWVHFYATQGIKSYEMLERMMAKYPNLRLSTVICPTLRENFTNQAQTKKGPSSIIGGEFESVITEDEATNLLTWASSIEPSVSKLKGKTPVFLRAAMFAKTIEGVDEDILATKIAEWCDNYKKGSFVPHDTLQCITQISEIYNNRRKASNRIDIELAYRFYISKTNPSAATRWLK